MSDIGFRPVIDDLLGAGDYPLVKQAGEFAAELGGTSQLAQLEIVVRILARF
jgi:hypothetical protein